MELIIIFALIVALLAALDLAAMKWGVNTRRTELRDKNRNDRSFGVLM